MSVFLYLILGHYLADFPLQGEFIATMKSKNNYLLFCHVIIYSLLIGSILDVFGLFAIWKLSLLVFSHFAIDYWKCHFVSKEKALTTGLYIDQLLHICVLVVLL